MPVSVITEIEVTADTTEVDITGLDINTHKFYLIIIVWKNPTGLNAGLKMFFNGDFTETNYWRQRLWASGADIGAWRVNESWITQWDVPDMAFYKVFVIRDVDGKARVISQGVPRVGDTVNIDFEYMHHNVALDNITRITIRSTEANAIGAGSKIQIYGYTP